jgi:hypothetical protein
MTAARWLRLLLGCWLFLSAFLWHHGSAQFANTWIVGVVMVALSVLALLGQRWARYLNAIAAVWLFFATLLLPDIRLGTLWNNCLVAMAVFVISMLPAEFGRHLRMVMRYHHQRYERGR